MSLIRPWRQTDLPWIQQVAWDTWEDAYGAFIPEADRREFHESYYATDKLLNLYNSAAVEGCVAVSGERVVGYSKTHWSPDRQEFFITSLYVLPEYQKLNLGKRMLDFGVEASRQFQVDRVWLGVMVENKPAIQWYLHHGFIFIEHRPFNIGNTVVDDLIGYKLI